MAIVVAGQTSPTRVAGNPLNRVGVNKSILAGKTTNQLTDELLIVFMTLHRHGVNKKLTGRFESHADTSGKRSIQLAQLIHMNNEIPGICRGLDASEVVCRGVAEVLETFSAYQRDGQFQLCLANVTRVYDLLRKNDIAKALWNSGHGIGYHFRRHRRCSGWHG